MTTAARVFSAFAVPVAMLLAACGPASEPVEQAMTPAVPTAAPVSAQPAPAPESPGVAAPTALSITDPSIARELMEVAGIRLGMTEAEAMAALNAFEPAATITRYTSFFNYGDGASAFQTDDFIDYVSAQSGTGNRINVYFSGPLGEPRVIKVGRSVSVVNGPTRTEFLNTLISRYGAPSGFDGGEVAELGNPVWEESGRARCQREFNEGEPVINVGRVGDFDMGRIQYFVEEGLTRRIGIHTAGLLPDEFTDCGGFLRYQVGSNGDLVVSFRAVLVDVAGFVNVERERSAWVASLTEEAVRRRQAQSQTPRL